MYGTTLDVDGSESKHQKKKKNNDEGGIGQWPYITCTNTNKIIIGGEVIKERRYRTRRN
jgi:hypothetical protein